MRKTIMSENLALQSADIVAEVNAAIDNASEELRRLSLEVNLLLPVLGDNLLLTRCRIVDFQ